jgi:GAF domain-containing protein
VTLAEKSASPDDDSAATGAVDASAPPPTARPDGSELTVESVEQLLTLVRADLAAELDRDVPPEQLLDQVLHVAIRLVPGADDASIALASDGALHTVSAAGDTAVAADDIQRALGDGPSQQVILDGQTLRVADLLVGGRWPEFGVQASEVGVRAVLACPLPLPRKRHGVLTLYSATPAAFDKAAELVVPVFAARAAIAIAYAEKVSNLQRAIESRQVIGQAIGILMERHRVSSKQAFDSIVTVSQESHIKLRELAIRINETGLDPLAAANAES